MAKSGVFERNPTGNLKKELQKLVEAIVHDSSSDEQIGFGFSDCVDKATQVLKDLKDLKEGKQRPSFSKNFDNTASFCDSSPHEFNCPLSKEIMRDPVIISSGKTYDRTSIQKWLKAGNRTCPKTEQVLSHTILTPNHLVRDMITQWCENRGAHFPSLEQYPTEIDPTKSDRNHFLSLLNKLSSSSTISQQKEAAKTLRSLTKKIPSFRAFFSESPDSIPKLLTPLSETKTETHKDLQEDLITTLLNLSIHDTNKKLVAETPIAIPVLLNALRFGNMETRSNSAATLFTLSAVDSNKSLIGKSGALKPLIDLLNEGNALAMKDAATAIFNLCILHENKTRAVENGAINVILNKIQTRVQVDELLAILAMLSSNQTAIEEMCDLNAVSCLFSLIKETPCERNKENCIVILYTICFNDRTKWKEMREEESRSLTLSQIAENGSLRARRKANGILDRINRPINRTHTA